ncbi:MAG: GTP-binding protein, partial [Bulleidia sp.]
RHEEQEAANAGLKEGNRVHIGSEEHEHHHHHHHHHGHDADEIFDSIGIETINTYTEEDIRTALSQLGENIIRAKGIVPSAEGWLFFDYVPGDIDIRRGTPAYTGLITVIGEKVDVEEIKQLFRVN